jgi:hypothetical protein
MCHSAGWGHIHVDLAASGWPRGRLRAVWNPKDEIKRFLRIREGATYCDGCLAREMKLRPSLGSIREPRRFSGNLWPISGNWVPAWPVRESGNAPDSLRSVVNQTTRQCDLSYGEFLISSRTTNDPRRAWRRRQAEALCSEEFFLRSSSLEQIVHDPYSTPSQSRWLMLPQSQR